MVYVLVRIFVYVFIGGICMGKGIGIGNRYLYR